MFSIYYKLIILTIYKINKEKFFFLIGYIINIKKNIIFKVRTNNYFSMFITVYFIKKNYWF